MKALVFGCDLRSLALARIVAGLVVLGDLVVRSQNFLAHYTNAGVMPLTALVEWTPEMRFPVLHMANDTPAFIGFLFLLQGFAALCLLVGYRTRLATFVCWYLLASLQYRNLLVNNGGDTLLRCLLFWGLFLPWERRFSVDGLKNRELRQGPEQVVNAGTVAFLVQMMVLYIFAGLYKWHPLWLEERSAVYYSLTLDHLATDKARLLLQHPEILPLLSLLVFGWELLGPLCFLIPSTRIRLVTVLLFAGMHFFFGFFIHIGPFRYTPLVGLCALLPGSLWSKLKRLRIPRPRLRPLARALARLRYQPQPLTLTAVETMAAGTLLLYVVLFNVGDILKKDLIPAPVHALGHATTLRQSWAMFTLIDKAKDGWFVMEATLEDGTTLDLLTGKAVSWNRPAVISLTYDGQRWRRYLQNLMIPRNMALMSWYAHYLCQSWDSQHPEQRVERLAITFLNDPMHLHYRFTPPEKWTYMVWEPQR